MSKRKHNIAYVKPDEPKFLRDLKLQAGYKEGPTVDTKREQLPELEDEDVRELDEEDPVVVVLKAGDLTADEADVLRKQKEEEEANAKADLTKRVIFKNKSESVEPSTKRTKRPKRKKAPLSFDEDADE